MLSRSYQHAYLAQSCNDDDRSVRPLAPERGFPTRLCNVPRRPATMLCCCTRWSSSQKRLTWPSARGFAIHIRSTAVCSLRSLPSFASVNAQVTFRALASQRFGSFFSLFYEFSTKEGKRKRSEVTRAREGCATRAGE